MSEQIEISAALYAYMVEVASREPPALTALRERTARMPEAGMQVSSVQGQFMTVLAELLGVRRGIEVGVFTGYSAACTALGMAPGGTLVGLDVSDAWTLIARETWAELGVSDRIDLRLAPALDTLGAMIQGGEAGTYDWVFLDADKENYVTYWERALTLLRPGGVILVDNVLMGGGVLPKPGPEVSERLGRLGTHVHRFNLHVRNDQRVSLAMTPIGDGLTIARKR
ncbi:O-methyltransferase [Zavarzinia sp. CC-PAN008]|uniref:O-methyltransferase n=1 Tax=Zavarzinia sp. CC-PAN008 TaxID=3243332 RepID=UPI003F749B88